MHLSDSWAIRIVAAFMAAVVMCAILAMATARGAEAAPCFGSNAAARTAYPTGRLTYQGVGGHKEWFKGGRGQHVKCDTKEARKEVMQPATRSARSLERQVHDTRPRPARSLAGAATVPSPPASDMFAFDGLRDRPVDPGLERGMIAKATVLAPPDDTLSTELHRCFDAWERRHVAH